MKLIVLDGNSIINRAFYGIRPLSSSDGTPTNAVFGFLNIWRRLINEEAPDAACVTFDLREPTFRHLQYDGYKAQRKGMPDELAAQMPILKDILDAMNVKRFELSGWEADDLIGTITRICGEKKWDSVIVTGDKDSFQLVDCDTTVRHVKSRMGQTETKLYDEAAFREEYGFDPIHMVDLKALMGDASDNIPGVAGVGEKTATDLIQRFSSIEHIYKNLDSIDIKETVRKKLDTGRDLAKMSYELAAIHCDAPLEFKPEDCILCPVDNDKLWELFKKLDFRKLAESFNLTPPAAHSGTSEEVFSGECVSINVETSEEAESMLAVLRGTDCVGISFSDDMDIFCAEQEHDENAAAYIISKDTTPDFHGVITALFSGEIKKAGWGIKDTIGRLVRMGIKAEGFVFDAEIAAYLLDPTASDYALSRLTEKYCGFSLEETDDDGQMSFLSDNVQELAWLMRSAASMRLLKNVLGKKLEESGLSFVMDNIELPLCPVLADMETAGFLVDRNALSSFGQTLSLHIDALQSQIFDLAGGEFNINSPKQLGEVLFEKLMLPSPKKTKTGYSTNADTLEKLRGRYPIIGLVLEYRELTKLKSTYADGLTKVIAPDGRIHTKFQMTVTATGRLSSTEPNLQNIPIRRELGAEIRKMFVASPGNVLVDADYSQIELRILAHISGDETMRKAFLAGEDIHSVTASQVFGVDPENVTPLMRSRAKAVNFGIVYGISAFSLSEDICVPVAEARVYINRYMEKYHGVRDYMESVVKQARADGFAATLYGRRRPIPELSSSNFNLRSFGERVARNMPIQGAAADIMKIAMINAYHALEKEIPQARLLLQVHDELIVECPRALADDVSALLRREMEGAAQLSVPLTADAKWGESWYDAK